MHDKRMCDGSGLGPKTGLARCSVAGIGQRRATRAKCEDWGIDPLTHGPRRERERERERELAYRWATWGALAHSSTGRVMLLCRSGRLPGPAREGKRILVFFTQFPINTKDERILGKIPRNFRKYENCSGDRLGYLTQLLYWTS
jgi:hypothetical protein